MQPKEDSTKTSILDDDFDVITYTGVITRDGYEALCNEVAAKKKASSALLVLSTPGGDPHAGFRIARALSHCYDHFDALIPRYCKSAGTLIVIGARTVYMDDRSELGPLDIQVKKGDEIIGQNSGLEFLKAVNYLQSQSMAAFRSYLLDLTQETGLATRVASDIAARLTADLFEPIAAQIDPLKLAEMQRATEIAFEYGTRLADKSKNLRQQGLAKLVAGYPSHGFVIDRKEAKSIFIDVRPAEGFVGMISVAIRSSAAPYVDSATPSISIQNLTKQSEGNHDQTAQHASGAQDGAAHVQSAIHGDIQNAQQGGADVVPVADEGAAAGAGGGASAANDPSGTSQDTPVAG